MARLVLSKREAQIAFSLAAEANENEFVDDEVKTLIRKLKASAKRGDSTISISRWG